jgi:CRP-like cAMP-binding protein
MRNWLGDLPSDTRTALMAVARPRRYAAGAIVYCSGDLPDGVFLIQEGTASLHLGRRSGEQLLLRIARPGEVLGEIVGIDGARAPVFATARSPLLVTAFPRAEFHRLMQAHPPLRDALVRALSVHLRAALKLLEERALLPLPERLRARLVRLARETDATAAGRAPVAIDITQAELAQMLGASRQATSKALAGLVAAGDVALRFRTVEVNPQLVRAVTEASAGPSSDQSLARST